MAKPAVQFADLRQQDQAVRLGMYVFLATELLLFGGALVAFVQSRLLAPAAFAAASDRLDLVLGTINTLILTGSTLTMTLAERKLSAGENVAAVRYLVSTVALGLGFLCIKAHEWHKEYKEGLMPVADLLFDQSASLPFGAELFFNFYFSLTGLHVLHMLVGLGLIIVALAKRLGNGRQRAAAQRYLGAVGLYWSFVDVVWLLIFSLLYLW